MKSLSLLCVQLYAAVYQYQINEIEMLYIHNNYFVTYMYTCMHICTHMYTDTNLHTCIHQYAYTIMVLDVIHIRPN